MAFKAPPQSTLDNKTTSTGRSVWRSRHHRRALWTTKQQVLADLCDVQGTTAEHFGQQNDDKYWPVCVTFKAPPQSTLDNKTTTSTGRSVWRSRHHRRALWTTKRRQVLAGLCGVQGTTAEHFGQQNDDKYWPVCVAFKAPPQSTLDNKTTTSTGRSVWRSRHHRRALWTTKRQQVLAGLCGVQGTTTEHFGQQIANTDLSTQATVTLEADNTTRQLNTPTTN